MTEIYSIITKEILFKDDSLSLKELVEKHKKDLYGAYLYGAYLYGANLGKANLREANLMGAKIGDVTILNYKEISGIGNEKRLLRCFLLSNNSFYFMAGCFSGTEQELKEKVIDKYDSIGTVSDLKSDICSLL